LHLEKLVLRKFLFITLLAGIMTGPMAEEISPDPVVDLSTLINLSGLVEKVSDKQVVYIGETHDQYQHHLNQLAIIKGLHTKHSDLAIGLEFFFQPYQSALDRYIGGEIDEAELIRETDYFNRWRFDYRLYRPILRFAKEQGIPLIGLNIEKEITDQVGHEGIDSLSDELKQRIPSQIDRDNEAYRSRLKTIFEAHPHREGSDFERFIDVQLLWDEAMAQRAAEWIEANPERHLVVLAGAGHLIYGYGIPDRVARRVGVSQSIVINANNTTELNSELADYLILTKDNPLPPNGKLGVFLNVEESPPSVTGFAEKSAAAEAGLEKKDQLISVDGQAISSYADVRIALMDRAAGETVKVEVSRERMFIGSIVETYHVTLR
jgi:uncharacterized iron-regulated protein